MAKRRGNHEGSIYNRSDGNWRAQITVNGERLSFAARTRKDAQNWLRQVNNQIEIGLETFSVKLTFGEYLQDWLASKRYQVTERSFRTYSQLVKDYIEPSLGKKLLKDISPIHIQRLYDQKASNGLGLRTVQKLHTVIHASLNDAVKSGLIGRNSSNALKPPKLEKAEMLFLNHKQVGQLIENLRANGDRIYPLIFLAITTGLRQGELLGLKWENVDLEVGKLTVQQNLVRIPGGGLALRPPKTETSIRTVKLGSESVAVLQSQKANIRIEENLRMKLWQDFDHVFPSTVGAPMDPSNLLKQFRKALRRAELPRIRFHDLRHTAASLMLNNGVEILAVSQRLGHASPSITLDVYGHLLPSLQNEAAEIMDKLVSS